ncbi:hypothetical protein PybrP1_001237 [[Pythium] brassicae (nom. inval.)]|nr:hypothetical protein PybrP1_001237 [[Pythium] brassicae (nom. inval.)]
MSGGGSGALGTCARMCPRAEVLERRRTGEISRFERPPPSSASKDDDFSLAVKKYRRAAAGQGELNRSELRPPKVLLETLQHLFARVLPWRGCGFDWLGAEVRAASDGEAAHVAPEREQTDFLALYHFVSDRVRSVRKDLTVQRIEDASAIEMLEKSARFHILAGLRASQLLSPTQRREGDWSETLNEQQLASALAQLHELYRKHAVAADSSARASAGEFVAYDILLHIDDPRAVSFMLVKVPGDVRRSARVKRALALFVALQTQDFGGFLRRFARATALEKSLVLKHLPAVWRTAVQAMNKAFGKLDKFPLEELAEWLRLGDADAARALCRAMELHIETAPLATTSVSAPPDSREHVADTLPLAPVAAAFVRFKVAPLRAADMDDTAKQQLLAAAAQRIHRDELVGRVAACDVVLSGAGAADSDSE